MRNYQKRKNNHTGEYAPNWPQIAAEIKKKGNYTCERCKMVFSLSDQMISQGKEYSLGVHHLDHNKSNDLKWNLACLCNRCHLPLESEKNRLTLELAQAVSNQLWLFPGLKENWLIPHVEGMLEYYKKGGDKLSKTSLASRGVN